MTTDKPTKDPSGAPYGEATAPDAFRIERLLPGPIDRVWSYLTESDKRAKWFASGPMDLRKGGKVEFRFENSKLSTANEPTPEKYQQYEGILSTATITDCDPPRLLTFNWEEPDGGFTVVSFELAPRDKEVLLILTHTRLANRDMLTSVATGWHSHLNILDDVLHNIPPGPFWSRHLKLEEEYEKMIPKEGK